MRRRFTSVRAARPPRTLAGDLLCGLMPDEGIGIVAPVLDPSVDYDEARDDAPVEVPGGR